MIEALTALQMVIGIALGLMTVASGAAATWQWFRAGKWKKGFGSLEKTLDAMVVAIQSLPNTPGTAAAKARINLIAETVGTEKERLAEAVELAQALLGRYGLEDLKPPDLEIVAKAVDQARAARAQKKGKALKARAVVTTTPLLGLLVGVVLLIGCSRHTEEIVWPGDPIVGYPPELSIIWPQGVLAADIWTGDVDGRAVSVAPLPLEGVKPLELADIGFLPARGPLGSGQLDSGQEPESLNAPDDATEPVQAGNAPDYHAHTLCAIPGCLQHWEWEEAP